MTLEEIIWEELGDPLPPRIPQRQLSEIIAEPVIPTPTIIDLSGTVARFIEQEEMQDYSGRMPSCPVYKFMDTSKGKRKCRNCGNSIYRGSKCLSWFEYTKPYLRNAQGHWIKKSMCLDCAAEDIRQELNTTRKLLKEVQYRRRHAKKVKSMGI